MKYTIDAQGKKIGRIASEAARHLMGKMSVSFAKNTVAQASVSIVNASKADVDSKKKAETIHVTYTGHRGGLENETLSQLIARKGMKEVITRAVYRMIPDNKLREPRMKNLTITE